MTEPEPQQRIRRAFDAAFARMCAATTEAEVEDETSNILHHLYRLRECRRKLANISRDAMKETMASTPGLEVAVAANKRRNDDTHDAVLYVALADAFSDFHTQLYDVAVWNSRAEPAIHRLPVLDTLREAFDRLATFPP